MRKQLLATVGGGSVLAAGWLARRYRGDLDAARARLAAVDRAGSPRRARRLPDVG
jgi:hypothetical protein